MIRHTLVASALALAAAAHAAAVQYDFGSDPNGSANNAPTATVSHLTASSTAFSGGGELCRLWNGDPDGWACGAGGQGTLSFTVTADAGWQFDVNGFIFEGVGMGDVPATDFTVTSSLDGFTQPLLQGDLTQQVLYQHYKYDTGFTAQGLHGPLELRITSVGGPTQGPAGGWLLDNLRLDVAVRPDATVPEPGTLALGALALLAAVRRGRSTPAGRPAPARPAHG